MTDARLLADGGSTWIAVTDASGKQIAFGVHGSLDRDALDFPIYLQRWYPVAPLPVPVDRNSSAGRALLEVVERAGRDGGPRSGLAGSLRLGEIGAGDRLGGSLARKGENSTRRPTHRHVARSYSPDRHHPWATASWPKLWAIEGSAARLLESRADRRRRARCPAFPGYRRR